MPKQHPVLQLDEETERKKITDYEWSCQTIVAMGNIVARNLKGTTFQGRPLRTSAGNSVSPDVEVKPDVQIEAPVPPEAAKYHAVNEIKANLPANHDFWERDVDQLQKYDDELAGWSRDFPNPHDILFTTNDLRVNAVNDYLSEKGITFKRKFAILHSTRMEQNNTFINVRKDFGHVSDPALEKLLSDGVGVNAIHVVKDINQMKFYDARPPVVYTMMIIWDHVLKTLTDFNKLKALRGRQAFPIAVTIDQIKEKLTQFAPESNSTCVDRDWVKEALEGFCDIGVATLIDGSEGRYEIRLRPQGGRDWIFERIRKSEAGELPGPMETLDEFQRPVR